MVSSFLSLVFGVSRSWQCRQFITADRPVLIYRSATPRVRLLFHDYTAVSDACRRLFLLLLLLLLAAACSWILQVAQSRVHKPRATKLFRLSPSVYGYAVWNLLYATLLAPRKFKWLLDVWRICAPLDPGTVHTKIYVHDKYAVLYVTIFYLILSWTWDDVFVIT